jgi:hypothetical protein
MSSDQALSCAHPGDALSTRPARLHVPHAARVAQRLGPCRAGPPQGRLLHRTQNIGTHLACWCIMEGSCNSSSWGDAQARVHRNARSHASHNHKPHKQEPPHSTHERRLPHLRAALQAAPVARRDVRRRVAVRGGHPALGRPARRPVGAPLAARAAGRVLLRAPPRAQPCAHAAATDQDLGRPVRYWAVPLRRLPSPACALAGRGALPRARALRASSPRMGPCPHISEQAHSTAHSL